MGIALQTMDELEAHLNREVGLSAPIALDQSHVDQFAELTQDRQWIHVDPERARSESPYESTIVHGFFTLSLLSRFLESVVTVEDARLLVSCGLESVRFLTPVPVGASLASKVRLRRVRSDDAWVEATWRFTIGCEGAKRPSCIADWVVRYLR